MLFLRRLTIKHFFAAIAVLLMPMFLINTLTRKEKVCTVYDYHYEAPEPIVNAKVRQSKNYDPNVDYQKWAVNFNILQYSSYIFERKTSLRVETIFAFGFAHQEGFINDTYIHKKIQCALRHRATNVVQYFNSSKVMKLQTRPMTKYTYRVPWKVICNIYNFTGNSSVYDIGIIDFEDYTEKMMTFGLSDTQMEAIIQFQKPKVIDTELPKFPAIAHCLHSIRNLDQNKTEKLLKWIKIQQILGYKEIKIYFFDDAVNTTNLIYQKFHPSFVKIHQHQMAYEEVCEWHIQNYFKNPDNSLATYLNNYCKAIWTRTFIFTDHYSDETNFIHGRSMTNDCFLQLKYKYEFLTNYDFDEVLLPRKYRPFEMIESEEYSQCDANDFKNNRYNVYDYAVELFNQYGKHNTSSVELECLPYWFNDQNMTYFLSNLTTATELNMTDTSDVVVPLEKVVLPLAYFKYIYFIVTPNDTDYVKYLLKQFQVYDCLKDTSRHTEFNNAITSAYNLPYLATKSIFNTDLVEYTSFHYGAGAPNSEIVKIPIEDGFVSHLRDNTDRYYQNQNIPITQFIIDIEYYKFFLNNY